MVLKMDEWFIFALVAVLLWGLWGFFPKLASNYLESKSLLVYEVLGVALMGFIIFASIGFKPQFHTKGFIFALLTGIAGTSGLLFFLWALSKGRASVVVTMTALYPLVTIVLASLILKEPITFKQGIGIIFALISMILLAG